MIHNHCIVSRQSVYKLMQGTHDRRKYPKTRKVLKIHKSVIDQQLQKDPEKTSESLQDMLKEDFGINLSTQHISRVRRELGWTAKRIQYCQMISNKNRHLRMDFCLRALSTKDTFENVIFTDETSVEMSATGKIFFYKKRSDIERLPAKAPPKHPYKVHMWGGISYRGRTRCCIFTGIMDSKIYQQILSNNLLPSVEQNFPDGFRLYQDNDSKHVSKLTKEWMESVQILESVMSTPASSPDLNPIENVWAALKGPPFKKSKAKNKG